jgi:DNA-binding transcriptional ArsR family regulator
MAGSPGSSALALFGKAKLVAMHALLAEPGRAMHLREIAREGDIAPSALARELDSMVAAGLLREERQGRLRLFCANPQSPLLPSLQKLTLALFDLESPRKTPRAATTRPVRSPKSRRLGLSAPFDWSNADIADDALIVKTAASLRFADVARLCVHYGLPRVRRTLKARITDPMALAILARQLRNIETAMTEDARASAA